ncbi:MAG: hypothetical protein IT284_00690 [Bacteroidetes bacterium]|nr:hypothetical protein [Bacteroidota bacterium]
MYIAKDYLPLKKQVFHNLKLLLKSKPNLRDDVQLLANANQKTAGATSPFIFLANLYDTETGFEHGSEGYFYFKLILDMDHLKRSNEHLAVCLYLSHVPQTDNGYNWETVEIHVHKMKPFIHRSHECNAFLAFMNRLRHPNDLEKFLRRMVKDKEGIYQPGFIKKLEALGELRKKILHLSHDLTITI